MRNKITFFSLFLLVVTVILGSIPNQAQASEEAESLFRIASQAHDELNIQLSNTDNVPSDAKQLFQQGTDGLYALKEAIKNEDTPASRDHFLSTMKIFKKITYMISDQPSSEATSVISLRSDHQSELERIEKYVISLKTLAERHVIDIDFTEIDKLFNSTKQQINEEQYDNAKKSIKQIKYQITDINKILREEAQQKTVDRAKTFTQKYLERLDKIISEAEKLGYSVDIVDKLKEAKEKLSKSSNPNQIIHDIKQILPIKQQFELFKFERIISKVNHMEEKLDNISITEESDSLVIEDAKSLIIELRIHIEERNYDDAQSILRTLTSMLNDHESSVN